MSWDDDNKGNKNKGKNPWANNTGKRPPKRQPQNKGGYGGRGGNKRPPESIDIDEIIKNAQSGFKDIIPGGINGGGNMNMDQGKAIALGVVILFLLWLASGFYMISPGQHGVIQRFGEWKRTKVTEGLDYHLPAPIETVRKVKVNQIRNMNIGFFSTSPHGGGRHQDIPEESQMLTSDRNIVDLDLVIQWNIKSAEDYLFNIEDPENTLKQVAESAIREVAGQTKMFTLITKGRDDAARRTQEIIQKNLDAYKSGIHITEVLIQQAEVHPDVQDAFQDVQSAKQDAEDTQNRARAYREDILPKARGLAIQMLQQAQAYEQSTIAKATGDAKRFDAIYQAYISGKDVTRQRIYLETMEQILSNAQKIIVDQKGTQGVVPYLPLSELGKNNTNNVKVQTAR